MPRAKYIAKYFILLIAILLLVGIRYANAQNTGEVPYIESEHAYRVSIGETKNSPRFWVVTDKAGIADTIDNTNEASVSWFDIEPATTDGGYEVVTIYFDSTFFTHLGTWYLQYFEYKEINDSVNCASAREFEIDIKENTFHLMLDEDQAVCNTESDSIHSYNEVDNDTGTELFNNEVTYTVTMQKDSAYSPDTLMFDAVFSQDVIDFRADVTTSDDGVAAPVSGTGDSIRVVVTAPTTGFSDSVEITLTVSFNTALFVESTPILTVKNGVAIVAGTTIPDAITYDNVNSYPDREQVDTIYALPATRDITYGGNDSEWSAFNPCKNSEHTYLIQMGDDGNYNNTGTGWMIVAISSGDTLAVNTDYSIVGRGINSGNDSIVINFDSITAGDYLLCYTETSNDGCSSVRADTLHVGGPFDVDIADNNRQCPDISGNISTYQESTGTAIEYTVTLESTYKSDWSFAFTAQIAQSHTDDEITVDSITVTDSNGNTSYTEGATSDTINVSVDYNASTPTSSLTVTVYYSGYYPEQYTVTAELADITGSYGEQDENTLENDEDDNDVNSDADSDQNNTVHYINKMPQAQNIAGID